MPEPKAPNEVRETLSDSYYASLTVDGIEYAIGSVEDISPRLALRSEQIAVPEEVQRLFLSGGDARTQNHYLQLEAEGQIDQEAIVEYVRLLLQNEARYLAEQLGIENLKLLSPKQAILLATRLVTDFTQYSTIERAKQEQRGAGHANPTEDNPADTMTPLAFLKASVAGKAVPDWEGLGVCRNFSIAVRAIFDSLKQQQETENYLRNVYCVIVSQFDGGVYDPKEFDVPREIGGGHAWNQFVTVIDNGAEVVGVDATWDQRDPDTHKELNETATLLRAEADVHELMQKLITQIKSGSDEAKQQFREGFQFYDHLISRLNSDKSVQSSWRSYTTDRALRLLVFSVESRTFGPKNLVNDVIDYYFSQPAPKEIAYVLQLQVVVTEIGRADELGEFYDRYIAENLDRSWSNMFMLHGKNIEPNHQIVADSLFERLQTQYAEEFAQHLETDGSFRAAVRLYRPEVKLGEFKPWENQADLAELKAIVFTDEYGEQRVLTAVHEKLYHSETSAITEAEFRGMVTSVRDRLRAIDEEFYVEHVASMSDYRVLRLSQLLKYGELGSDL